MWLGQVLNDKHNCTHKTEAKGFFMVIDLQSPRAVGTNCALEANCFMGEAIDHSPGADHSPLHLPPSLLGEVSLSRALATLRRWADGGPDRWGGGVWPWRFRHGSKQGWTPGMDRV